MSGLRALLLDTANRLFEAATDDDVFEGLEAGRFPADHWRAIEENGLADVLLPEAAGRRRRRLRGRDGGGAGGGGVRVAAAPGGDDHRSSAACGCGDSNLRRGRWVC